MTSVSWVGRKKNSESPTGFVNVTTLLFGCWFSPLLPRFFNRSRSHFLKAGFLVRIEEGGGTGEGKTKRKFFCPSFYTMPAHLTGCQVCGNLTGRGGGGGWGADWYKSQTSSFISVSFFNNSWEQPREIDSKRKQVKNSGEFLRMKWFCSWSWEF